MESELVKRIHNLENIIDNSPMLNSKLADLKKIQKQMVNAKEFNQTNQYLVYKKQYDDLYQTILDYPFVEEYLDLLDEANFMLNEVTTIIEKKINKILEE